VRAREAVNESLRKQARRPVQVSDRALLAQLRQDGWLLDAQGQPLPAEGEEDPTSRTRLEGHQVRCFLLSKSRLLGV
jgi:hypothetical protein